MGREIRGVVGGKFHVKDDEVIMIYEKKVTRMVMEQRLMLQRDIWARAYVVIVKD